MARFLRLKVLNTMVKTGMVPVFYHHSFEVARDVARACLDGGCKLLEFTNRGDNAWEVFSQLSRYCARDLPEMILGVGSVVDPGTASLYMNCGANFVVGPILNADVARAEAHFLAIVEAGFEIVDAHVPQLVVVGIHGQRQPFFGLIGNRQHNYRSRIQEVVAETPFVFSANMNLKMLHVEEVANDRIGAHVVAVLAGTEVIQRLCLFLGQAKQFPVPPFHLLELLVCRMRVAELPGKYESDDVRRVAAAAEFIQVLAVFVLFGSRMLVTCLGP